MMNSFNSTVLIVAYTYLKPIFTFSWPAYKSSNTF